MFTVKKSNNKSITEKFYRVERFAYDKRLRFVAFIFYRLIYLLFNCVIPPTVKIGEGTKIPHGCGIVMHYKTVIGKNCTVYQNVTIGSRGEGGGSAVIGDNVIIGANACILGRIKIGDNAKIGAGCVVLEDVPPGATVVGNPARIVNTKVNH